MADETRKVNRRAFVREGICLTGAVGLGGLSGLLAAKKAQTRNYVWQLDPDKCIACDKCRTDCVLDVSAVKAVQCFSLCGYCDKCTGYFPAAGFQLNTGAENQLCPTGAIDRKFVEEQAGVRYFEYTISESLCIGCGKCVAGCQLMNGSLYLQVRHDRCLNCNECTIALACPAEAFSRVPAGTPILLKRKARAAVESRLRELAKKLAKKPSEEEAKRLKRSKEELEELLNKDARAFLQELQEKVQRG